MEGPPLLVFGIAADQRHDRDEFPAGHRVTQHAQLLERLKFPLRDLIAIEQRPIVEQRSPGLFRSFGV